MIKFGPRFALALLMLLPEAGCVHPPAPPVRKVSRLPTPRPEHRRDAATERPAPEQARPEDRPLDRDIDQAFADWESARLVPALTTAENGAATRPNGPDAAQVFDDSIPTIVVRPAASDAVEPVQQTPPRTDLSYRDDR